VGKRDREPEVSVLMRMKEMKEGEKELRWDKKRNGWESNK
jgi:hypothetical protein